MLLCLVGHEYTHEVTRCPLGVGGVVIGAYDGAEATCGHEVATFFWSSSRLARFCCLVRRAYRLHADSKLRVADVWRSVMSMTMRTQTSQRPPLKLLEQRSSRSDSIERAMTHACLVQRIPEAFLLATYSVQLSAAKLMEAAGKMGVVGTVRRNGKQRYFFNCRTSPATSSNPQQLLETLRKQVDKLTRPEISATSLDVRSPPSLTVPVIASSFCNLEKNPD
jgi:hypothetical protein